MTTTAESTSEATLGQLVAHATADLSQLVRQEVALAKLELKKEVKFAGLGAGLLGAAAFLGLVAFLFVSIALAFGLAGLGLPLGVGFLLVAVLYLLVAAVFGLLARKSLKKIGPPERTIETVKDDVAWAKHPTQAPTRRA